MSSTPSVAWDLLTVASSQGGGLILSFGYLGEMVFYVPFSGMTLVSKVLFSTARNTYCLSWLKLDKIFEKIFFFF